MLGRLSFDALPFYSPVAFAGAAVTTIALALAAVMAGIMIAGCVWVMFDLHNRMMP